MKSPKGPHNTVASKRVAPPAPTPLFSKYLRPFYLFLILCLTFGFSAVGRAAQRIKKVVKAKKQAWKATHMEHATARAWAFFRPAWQEAYDDKYPSPVARTKGIIDDPQNRIEREFRVSRGLKGRVAFWIDIYSRFTSHYRVIHDRDNPELVYGYLDLRPVFRALPPGMARWRRREIEDRVVKELKARIAEATGMTNPRNPRLSDEEKDAIKKMLDGRGFDTRDNVARRLRRIKGQTGQRDHFMAALVRARKVLPQIEEVFREKGLPVALTRIPFVESSFNMGAVSHAGAIGMWQFLPEVAKRYDPSGSTKEWRDPVRQTRSAARMLTLLKERVDNWGIAVTAYHSGVLRLERIKKQFKADDIEDMIDLPPQQGALGYAGKNYFPELLAANLVEAYREDLFPSSFHSREAPRVAKKEKKARQINCMADGQFFKPVRKSRLETRGAKARQAQAQARARSASAPYRARSAPRRG